MLKRENRLVAGVRFNNSRFLSIPEFVLKAKENGLSLNRFGVVVSKKIDKRAVGRNKIKRMFRDIFMNLNKNMVGGYDILTIVKIGAISKTREEAGLLIKEAMRRVGIYE